MDESPAGGSRAGCRCIVKILMDLPDYAFLCARHTGCCYQVVTAGVSRAGHRSGDRSASTDPKSREALRRRLLVFAERTSLIFGCGLMVSDSR